MRKSAFPLLFLVACAGPSPADGPDQLLPPHLEPAAVGRLTEVQYRHAVRDLLGGDMPHTPLQADTRPYLFASIGASTTTFSEQGSQRLEESAQALSEAAFSDPEHREALAGCAPVTPGDPCVASFLDDIGERAYRRPLTEDERSRWLWVATDLAEDDPWQGMQLAVAGMLQSPHFLYRVHLGEQDVEDPLRYRLTDYEVASRLSFLLWNTVPDHTLMAAAAAGELGTADQIETQARRLLEDPRARATLQDFFDEYLALDGLNDVQRDTEFYPDFSPDLLSAMRTEVRLLVDDHVTRRDIDVRKIFSTRRTYVNAPLAAHYGIEAEGSSDVAFVPVELPEDGPRAGLLTLGAFLTMNAHPVETSPTLRGKYLLERVLCTVVPPPPDDVNLDLSGDDGTAVTLRERLELHREHPDCVGCHSVMDPPGYFFEHFDATGQWRDTELGHPIDSSGSLPGVQLADARELAEHLSTKRGVGRCMVKQLYRHAHGRLDTPEESVNLDHLYASFESSDFRFRELVVALVRHDSFRYVAAPDRTEEQR